MLTADNEGKFCSNLCNHETTMKWQKRHNIKKSMLCLVMSDSLSDPMDYSPTGSSVHGIFQARILESVSQSVMSNSL